MTNILQLKNIIVNPTGEKTILLVPNLEIHQGEILGIMGPNGAGKSTLIKLLALLEAPNEGSIFYRSKEVETSNIPMDLRRKFAIAMQQSLLLDMNVFQNVALGLKLRKLGRAEIRSRVEFWLEKFRIAHLAKKHAYHLSGGEAQRVNLARAMVLEPEILFLDEPFSALDFPTKLQLLKDLKEIVSQTKTTLVFISHDLMEINYMTERLVILISGEIKQIGVTSEVISNPNKEAAVFIDEWDQFLMKA